MRRVAPVLLALALALPATADASATGRLLVSIEPHAGEGAASGVLARTGARATGRDVPQVGLLTVRPREGESRAALARRLRADRAVRSVTPERRADARLVPNDPALITADPSPSAQGEALQWWATRSNFPAAWDLANGDSVTIAMIDEGVDTTHPEIAPKIRRATDFDPLGGPAVVDESGHGTHVASLACGVPNNGIGIAGAGYDCGLIVEKSDLSDSSVIKAIVDATDHGADIISMSLGTDNRRRPPRLMVEAINYAHDRGVVLIAAAANRATAEQGDPANILQPTGTGSDLSAGKGLTVTAADFSGRRADFAGFGSQISMAAYGALERPDRADGVLGAFPPPTTEMERGHTGPPCRCRAELAGDDRFAFLQGTSMATAIVAGAAALVLDRNPELKPDDVIRTLKETAQRRAGTGWTKDLGWGIVDARAAVEAAGRLDRHAPRSSVTAPATASGRRIVLRLRAEDPAAYDVAPSGVRRVRVYRSVDGGPAKRIAATARRRLRVKVKPGSEYAFSTRAVDRAGNVEAPPESPDAQTRVLDR